MELLAEELHILNHRINDINASIAAHTEAIKQSTAATVALAAAVLKLIEKPPPVALDATLGEVKDRP